MSPEEAAEFHTEWLEPSNIWPKADYITVHVPLIPPTKGTTGNCNKENINYSRVVLNNKLLLYKRELDIDQRVQAKDLSPMEALDVH